MLFKPVVRLAAVHLGIIYQPSYSVPVKQVGGHCTHCSKYTNIRKHRRHTSVSSGAFTLQTNTESTNEVAKPSCYFSKMANTLALVQQSAIKRISEQFKLKDVFV